MASQDDSAPVGSLPLPVKNDDREAPDSAAGQDDSGDKVPSKVAFLVEIVGATNLAPSSELSGELKGSVLPNASIVSSRLLAGADAEACPYVKVRWGDRKVHKTDTIPSSNNPIWTVDSGSLFLLDATYDDLLGDKSKTLAFEVRDKDMLLKKTALLGTVRIDADRLLQSCTEERLEFRIVEDAVSAARDGIISWDDEENEGADGGGSGDEPDGLITPLLGAKSSDEKRFDTNVDFWGDDTGLLALRFRLATQEDLRFMNNLKGGKLDAIARDHCKASTGDKSVARRASSLITEEPEGLVGVKSMMDSFSFTFNATTKDRNGNMKLRVKPGPDPQRREKTTFLSEEELLAAAYAPSKKWVEAGSGKLGKIFVEVLHCEGLLNCDVAGAVGNKTDAFVSLVYEDVVVQTDRIDDSNSPLWMPWTQRAFACNRMHPLSSLYIGVFNYSNLSPLGHDGIGRVAVNLEQFRPDFVYTLKYNIYKSSIVTDRESSGTITIRLRIEAPDEKMLLMESIKPTPRVHINVTKKKSLSVIKYTCCGQDDDKFDMKMLKSLANELLEYKQSVTYSVGDAIKSLLFWKGQVQVGALNLPLHSMTAFMNGVYVVERPHLLPSFCFFCIAWFMLASYGHRVQHPSPWHRCRPIKDFIGILRHGKSPPVWTKIKAREGAREAAAFEQAWKHRLQSDMEAANKKEEMQQELSNIGNDKIHTDENGLQIDPMARLYPIQRKLQEICFIPRFLKGVITWENSTLSFFVTITSLAVCVLLFILPSAFLLQWLCRSLVWTFLGPWMKLVGMMFESSVDFENEGDRIKHHENTVKEIVKKFKEMSKRARIKGEDALKLKAIRMLRLGRFIAEVPSLNVTRYHDYPLADSTAMPSLSPTVKGWDDRDTVPGQKLYGVMIPGQSSIEAQSGACSETKDQLAALQKIALEKSARKGKCAEDDQHALNVKLMPVFAKDGNASAEEGSKKVECMPNLELEVAQSNFRLAQTQSDLEFSQLQGRKLMEERDCAHAKLKAAEAEIERLKKRMVEIDGSISGEDEGGDTYSHGNASGCETRAAVVNVDIPFEPTDTNVGAQNQSAGSDVDGDDTHLLSSIGIEEHKGDVDGKESGILPQQNGSPTLGPETEGNGGDDFGKLKQVQMEKDLISATEQNSDCSEPQSTDSAGESIRRLFRKVRPKDEVWKDDPFSTVSGDSVPSLASSGDNAVPQSATSGPFGKFRWT